MRNSAAPKEPATCEMSMSRLINEDSQNKRGVLPSVATPKAAMDGHLKSGHMRNDVRDKISTPSVFMKATTVLILD